MNKKLIKWIVLILILIGIVALAVIGYAMTRVRMVTLYGAPLYRPQTG